MEVVNNGWYHGGYKSLSDPSGGTGVISGTDSLLALGGQYCSWTRNGLLTESVILTL